MVPTSSGVPARPAEHNSIMRRYPSPLGPVNSSANPSQDNWRVRLARARLWADTVNRHGGDATVEHLPDIGIHGNMHFIFSDLHNVQIADLLSKFLKEKGVD